MGKDEFDDVIIEALEDLVSRGLNHTATLLHHIDKLYEDDFLSSEEWDEVESARAFVDQLTEEAEEE